MNKFSKTLCVLAAGMILQAGAIVFADTALQSTPEMLEKYKNVKVYYLTDMPGEIEDFEKAIKKNPLDPENYSQIAVRYANKAYSEKDDWEKMLLRGTAIDYYSQAIELNPYNYRYLELRASLLKESGLSTLAAKDYEKVIDLINNKSDLENPLLSLRLLSYINYAHCIEGTLDKKEYLHAEKVLIKGTELLADYPAIYVALGDFYKGNHYIGYKNYKKAIAAYNEALKLNPNYVEAYIGVAYIYNLQEKYNESIIYYTKAIENANDLVKPFYYKYRADCYFDCLKDYTKAKEDYKKAIELFKMYDKKFGLSLTSPDFIAECERYIKECDNKLD